jgi:hypothetical protein
MIVVFRKDIDFKVAERGKLLMIFVNKFFQVIGTFPFKSPKL